MFNLHTMKWDCQSVVRVRKFSKLSIFVSLMIIFEMLFTGLGYCGHDHDHGEAGHTCSFIVFEMSAHQHIAHGHSFTSPEKGSSTDDACQPCATHCSCLGGFVGDIPQMIHQVSLLCQRSATLSQAHYRYFELQSLERPPQTLS